MCICYMLQTCVDSRTVCLQRNTTMLGDCCAPENKHRIIQTQKQKKNIAHKKKPKTSKQKLLEIIMPSRKVVSHLLVKVRSLYSQ